MKPLFEHSANPSDEDVERVVARLNLYEEIPACMDAADLLVSLQLENARMQKEIKWAAGYASTSIHNGRNEGAEYWRGIVGKICSRMSAALAPEQQEK